MQYFTIRGQTRDIWDRDASGMYDIESDRRTQIKLTAFQIVNATEEYLVKTKDSVVLI